MSLKTFKKTFNLLFILLFISSLTLIQINPIETSALSYDEYLAEKAKLESKISDLDKEYKKAKKNASAIRIRKENLDEEVADLKSRIANAENLIIETESIIINLENEISENKAQLENLRKDQKEIIKILQIQNRQSPVEIILTSNNIGEAMSQFYSFSSLESRVQQSAKSISDINKEIEYNIKSQDETIKKQGNLKILLENEKFELEEILEKTKQDQAEYEKLIAEQKAGLSGLKDYLGDLTYTPPNPPTNPTPDPGGGGDQGCSFTDSRSPGISKGWFQAPATGPVTGTYGCPPTLYLPGYNHDGIDIGIPIGTNLKAAQSGTVIKVANAPKGYGLYMVLRHILPSGKNIYTLYAHLSQNLYSTGTAVSKGQVIAKSGNTGFSTGPHLHFQIVTDSADNAGSFSCAYGKAKCYNPATYIYW